MPDDKERELYEEDPVFGKVVSRYSSEQAEKDGILYNILSVWPKSLVSHVTANLMSNGYLKESGNELDLPNLADLLYQSIQKMRAQSPDDVIRDFYSMKVEFPDGESREVWAARNEYGRLTLMLPEDY